MKQSLSDLNETLSKMNISYELLEDELDLSSAQKGAEHYGIDITNAAPTFIVKIDERFIAIIMRGDNRIDFNKVKNIFNTKNVSLATSEQIQNITGAGIGYVSLINTNLETFIDDLILEKDFVYGGCGIQNATLKIATNDLCKITNAKVVDIRRLG